MSKINYAPIQDNIITNPKTDDNGVIVNAKATKSYISFFQNLVDGDPGNVWSPVVHNLGATGTPTITGNFYQNQGFIDFWIRVTPQTNTSSTAGTTYFDLPFTAIVPDGCFTIVNAGSSTGTIIGNVCYPAAWSNVTVPVTITGRVRVQ